MYHPFCQRGLFLLWENILNRQNQELVSRGELCGFLNRNRFVIGTRIILLVLNMDDLERANSLGLLIAVKRGLGIGHTFFPLWSFLLCRAVHPLVFLFPLRKINKRCKPAARY